MRGKPTNFWGKLQRDASDQVTAWHPLVAHCADVAAVAEVLLSLPISDTANHRDGWLPRAHGDVVDW